MTSSGPRNWSRPTSATEATESTESGRGPADPPTSADRVNPSPDTSAPPRLLTQ